MMLTEINIRNFKCFGSEITVPVEQINLFTGHNGRGKSTVLQTLLSMRQSIEKSRTTDKLFLNGNCIELGSFMDIKNSKISRRESIVFGFEYSYLNEEFYKLIYYFREDDDDLVARIDKIEIGGAVKDRKIFYSIENINQQAVVKEKVTPYKEIARKYPFYNLFPDSSLAGIKDLKRIGNLLNFERIHYVSADRIGPRDYYPRQSYIDFYNVGSKGQYTIDILARLKNNTVNKELVINKNIPETLLDQASAWISYIFKGGKIDIQSFDANIISMRVNADDSINMYRPVNVGFGYSYALPIIVSGLIAKNGDSLIVENPEAHLVPMAQSRLANFLARVSMIGVQVFIETHSEHILNGLRIAVFENLLRSKDTNIIYFAGDKEYHPIKIPISDKGRIENWPERFFDQTERDLDKLHGI